MTASDSRRAAQQTVPFESQGVMPPSRSGDGRSAPAPQRSAAVAGNRVKPTEIGPPNRSRVPDHECDASIVAVDDQLAVADADQLLPRRRDGRTLGVVAREDLIATGRCRTQPSFDRMTCRFCATHVNFYDWPATAIKRVREGPGARAVYAVLAWPARERRQPGLGEVGWRRFGAAPHSFGATPAGLYPAGRRARQHRLPGGFPDRVPANTPALLNQPGRSSSAELGCEDRSLGAERSRGAGVLAPQQPVLQLPQQAVRIEPMTGMEIDVRNATRASTMSSGRCSTAVSGSPASSAHRRVSARRTAIGTSLGESAPPARAAGVTLGPTAMFDAPHPPMRASC
jgi:hypothetical protein